MFTRKRILALVLTLALTLSCIPMGALQAQAAELETDTSEVTETVPEETTEETTEDVAEAPTEEPVEAVTEEAAEVPTEKTEASVGEPQWAYADETVTYSVAHTQAEAIAWVKSLVGTSIEADGAVGDCLYQCVDLIVAYYKYLGVSPSSGDGKDYATNTLPSGWQQIKNAVPQAGDILVYEASTANPAGHVAIYESDFSTYHQNFGGSQKVEQITQWRYDGFTNNYWGVVRPDFTPVATTMSWGSDNCQTGDTDAYIYTKATSNVGGTFTQAGISIWQNETLVGTKTENISTNSTYLEVWYNLNEELGLTLTPGTTYTYQFFVVFNGTKYTSPTKSFTTTGTSPTQPQITWNDITCQTEEKNVQTSVRATSNVQGTFTQKGIILSSSSIGQSPLTITEDINVTGSALDIAYGTDNEQISDYIYLETTYKYQFFVVFNGVQYTSPENSFYTSYNFPICGNWGPDGSDSVTYTLEEDGTLTFSGTGDMKDGQFGKRTYVKRVIIGEGITSVGKDLFETYKGYGFNLESVRFPSTLKSIGEQAFHCCEETLTEITLPEGLTTIGAKAFSECDGLISIKIPGSVTSMGNGTFRYCANLKEVTILSGLTSIPALAFAKCENLQTVTIPDSVTSIGSTAFCNTALTSVVIPKNVASIGLNAFAYCPNLTEITFEGNAPVFEENVFASVSATAYYPLGDSTWTADVMQDYGGTITWVPYQKAPEIPVPAKPYKIANVVSGVHVYWTAMDGVAKFGLWRSETGEDGTYKWIANPTVPHFTDTNVESGKTYYYKVTAMDANGKHSEKSEAIGVTYVSTPDITSRSNVAAGVKLGWEKITGATGYAIYRKSYDGDDAWVRVGTISGNSTFTWTDTSVKNNNGEIYKYTIRALAGSDMKTLSGCRNAGRTMVRLSSQVLTSAAKASTTSIKCTWTTSSRVTGYEIRFMVGSTVYKTFTVGSYKTGVKTFTGLTSGQTYTIQVRTYKKVDGVGSFYSDWSTAKTVTLK